MPSAGPSAERPAGAPVVILVRPQLGENVGTTARAMLNFGLTELRLVEPKCGWPSVKALQAASGATEILNGLRIFDRVEEAVADLELLFATTARPRDLPKRVVSAAGAAREARAALAEGRRVGVLFGPERTGLSNDDLIFADAVLSVPLNPDFTSLNLAQAVLLVGYEWFQAGGPAPPRQASAASRRATKGELDQLVEHLVARARRGGVLSHRRSAPEHGAHAQGDRAARRPARGRRAPAARRDQGAGRRPAPPPAKRLN